MGADFNFQVSLRVVTHPQPFPQLREGEFFLPCEGGLKEGADFNFQVFLRDITHPYPFPHKGREQNIQRTHVVASGV